MGRPGPDSGTAAMIARLRAGCNLDTDRGQSLDKWVTRHQGTLAPSFMEEMAPKRLSAQVPKLPNHQSRITFGWEVIRDWVAFCLSVARIEHRARLGSRLRRADHGCFLELIDQAGGARVSDPQAAL